MPVGLSKSRTLKGLQCHKLLWWMAHEPAAAELEVDPLRRAVLEQGREVGIVARRHVPGGVLVDLPHDAYEARLAATREALAQGAPAVYEAAFRADGVFVSVDILERQGHRFCLTEVKSTTSVRDAHLLDVAVQAHVARRSGLDVGRMEVMHLNRACAYPDLGNLFIRADVTEAAEPLLHRIPREIDALADMLAGPVPRVATGEHCSRPHPCPFAARCWPELPPHHVSTLYAMRDRALELDEQGYRTIFDLPEDVVLSPAADRQRRAVQTGQLVVDPGLAEALAGIEPPVAFLDFETVGLADPGLEWLPSVRSGPRAVQLPRRGHRRPRDAPRVARRGARGPAAGAGRAPRRRVRGGSHHRRLQRDVRAPVPRAARRGGRRRSPPRSASIAERLVDLLPIVRNHVYHPDFGGSFSLKRVLPALVPGASYDDLAIADGQAASLELARLLLRGDEIAPACRKRRSRCCSRPN